jgi:hypothetical protein
MLRSDLHGRVALLRCPVRIDTPARQRRRLHENHDVVTREFGDQCSAALNFDPKRPLREILATTGRFWNRSTARKLSPRRLSKLASMLDRSGHRNTLADGDIRKSHGGIDMLYGIINKLPACARAIVEDLRGSRKNQPGGAALHRPPDGVIHAPGPFSRRVIDQLDERIAELDATRAVPPQPVAHPGPAAVSA